MNEALHALNQIVADRVIQKYAIGGAVGAAFYIEATQTEGIDVFVYLQPSPSGLVTLEPIFAALEMLGGIIEDGYVRFGDWPVQILSDATPLIAEAIEAAIDVPFDGIPTRIFTAEHLCAVGLEAGRPKDYLRVTMFLEQGEVDRTALRQLAERYGLTDRLKRVLPEFGGPSI
jgi:hypothetical protein